MSYKKVEMFGRNIKINTLCACGFVLGSAAALHNADVAHANNQGEPFIKVIDAAEHEDDPNALAALTFATGAALCARKLADEKNEKDNRKVADRSTDGLKTGNKKNEKDNRKVADRFLANFKDGMSF